MSNPTSADHMHRLDFGRAGSVTLQLQYRAGEITAALDVPKGLNRPNRRHVRRWMNEIFCQLDPDPRGLQIVTKCKGRVVLVGVELHGIGAVCHA